MKRKLFILLTIFVLVIPVSATQVTQKKNQLNNTKQSIKESKQELENAKQQKEKVKEEIKSLDQKIVKIEDRILQVEDQLAKKEIEIENAEKELQTAILRKDVQYEATKKRMVQMYKNKKTGYLQLLFTSGSFWEIINRAEYIQRIAEKDENLILDYQRQVEDIDEKKKELEQQKQDIELLYKEQISIKSSLNSTRTKKDSALAQLAGEEEKLQAQIKEMEEISKKLEAEIRKLTEQSTLKYTGGLFLWPVPGNYTISSEYNSRTSPISGKYEFHSGIDIPAPYGKSVLAAADGVVITAGWVNGYGNTVMINHGSGLVTLYGHNSSLLVSNGQTVKRGDAIARVGSTGYSTGNHVHFEVRVNGNHTNPWKYIKQ